MLRNPGSQKPSRAEIDSPVPIPPWLEKSACPRCKEENTGHGDFCPRCGFSFLETRAGDGPAPSSSTDLVGTVINGKYRVLSVLGEGGFGIVYKVELLLFDTANIFALKLLHPALSQDRTFRRRFLREAGLAMSLIHENTIQIREFGQTDDGHLFFTMDYCTGEPLKNVIQRERYLTVNRALVIVRQMLSVMRLAHARGIVHRDIKPENIFLEKDPYGRDFVKVGDFGLAKSFSTAEATAQAGTPGRAAVANPVVAAPREDITRGGIVGTPRYMSPEQSLGREDIDDRADIYSIGVVLHEMLYGQLPADRRPADADISSLKTPATGSPHPVPRAVWDIVRKATRWDREDRYQGAQEFLDAIDALPVYTPTYLEPAAPGGKRSAWWLPLFGAVAVVAAALAGVFFWGGWGDWLPREAGEPGQALNVLAPRVDEAGSRAADIPAAQEATRTGVASGAATASASAPVAETSRLRPWTSPLRTGAPGGIRAYVDLRRDAEYRYQTYREGWVPDREVVYKITDDPAPGRYTVKVTPGDRTITWLIDDARNSFYQEFLLPDPETGDLAPPVTRLKLRLPESNTLVESGYLYEDVKVHARRVDLPVPGHPKYAKFTDCLCVESREGDRIRCEYFQEGRGMVALLVFEPRAASPGRPGAPTKDAPTPPADPSKAAGSPVPQPPGVLTKDGSSPDVTYVVVFAKYLIGD